MYVCVDKSKSKSSKSKKKVVTEKERERLALLRKGKPAWNKGLHSNNKPWPYTQQTKDRISEGMKAYWATDAASERRRRKNKVK